MKKTNKKTLEEIIRVDHAGERGAIKIYEGQLLALNTFRKDEKLKVTSLQLIISAFFSWLRSSSLFKASLLVNSQIKDSLKKPCSIPKW